MRLCLALLIVVACCGGAQLDGVLFGIQASDYSIGRIPNANG